MIAIAAIFGATACGADKAAEQRNTYADQVNRAQNNFAQSFKSLSRRITSTTTPGRGRKTLQGFENAVDDVVVDLRRIDAPGDLQPLHQRLISEISATGARSTAPSSPSRPARRSASSARSPPS